MTFTPLEALSLTAFVTVVTGLVVHALTRRNYVSHTECEERRVHVCSTLKAVQDDHAALRQDLKDRTNILFRMVRALIAHDKDMPDGIKAEILNETPGGK